MNQSHIHHFLKKNWENHKHKDYDIYSNGFGYISKCHKNYGHFW